MPSTIRAHDAVAPSGPQEQVFPVSVEIDTDRDDLTSALWYGVGNRLGWTCAQWPDDPKQRDFARAFLYWAKAAPRPRTLRLMPLGGDEIGTVTVREIDPPADPEARLTAQIAQAPDHLQSIM